MNARVKVTEAAIAGFAKTNCRACGGVGVLTVRKAVRTPWTSDPSRSSSSVGPPVTRLCGCGLRRVLRIPGVAPDPVTNELFFTPPLYGAQATEDSDANADGGVLGGPGVEPEAAEPGAPAVQSVPG